MNLIDILNHSEKTISQKRKNAKDIMVVIKQLNLMDDMMYEISRFLFWDIRTEEYELHQYQQIYQKMKINVISSFRWLTSRNPTSDLNDMEQWFVKYVSQRDNNDIVGYENPHIGTYLMLSRNCCICGDYVHSFNEAINQPHRIFCKCIREYE